MRLTSYYYCINCGEIFKYKYNNNEDLPNYIICPKCHGEDLLVVADLFIYEPKLWRKFKKEHTDEA